MNVARDSRLYFLDALRGVCAALVAMRHESPLWGFELFRTHLAVDLFFLMSGYVLAASYGEDLKSGRLTTGRFIAVRLIRFLPVYWLSLLVIATIDLAASVSHGTVSVGALWPMLLTFAREMLLLPNLLDGKALFVLNGVAWSLFFELLLNIALAISLRRLPRPVLWIMTGLFALSLLRLCLWYGTADRGFIASLSSLGMGVARSGFGIFLGAMMATSVRLQACAARCDRLPWLAMGLAVAALLIPDMGPGLNGWIDALFIVVVFPPLLLMMARSTPDLRLLRWCALLGAASYPLYLLHGPATQLVRSTLPDLFPSIGLAMLFSAVLGAICVLVDRRFDLPVRRALRQQLPLPRITTPTR